MKTKTLPLLRWIDGRMGENLKPTPCASVWKRACGQQVEECSACAYSGAANWRLGWHWTVREGCQSRKSSAELTRQRLFLGFQLSVSRLATGPRQTQEICSPPHPGAQRGPALAGPVFPPLVNIRLPIFKTTIPSVELAAHCPKVSTI